MMTKIEEVKVETIENTKQPKGTETIETIYPETLEVPTYDYGNSQNTLDYEVSLRRKPNLAPVATTGDYNDLINTPTITSNFYAGEFTKSSQVGMHTQSITGVGFKPKQIIIYGVKAGSLTSGGDSEGVAYDNGTSIFNYCKTTYNNSGINYSWDSRAINVYSGGNQTYGSISNMDSDGFTINWDTASIDNIKVIYICFG